MTNGRDENNIVQLNEIGRFYSPTEYKRIKDIKNPLERQQALDAFAREGAAAGVKNVKRMFAEYVKSENGGQLIASNATSFDGQQMELLTGEWEAGDTGIYLRDDFGREVCACPHPIMPVQRLRNVDTGQESMMLMFRRGKLWQGTIVRKSTLASARSIVDLADHGISVTSETAKYLVTYLNDVENYNYDDIPTVKSVSRLGYVGEEFSPYSPGLIFDGDAAYRQLFAAVGEHGDRDKWLALMRQLRADSLAARIIIAASFASALVQPLGSLPFFVHLWGSESGTGKTVALMAAASVWGDPSVGRYVQTFHSTAVGHERLAAFLNSLPVVIDELQLAAIDRQGNKEFNVYRLAEGVGKSRGNKQGGMDKTPTWANTILTSGESPIITEHAAAGIRNRVIEIECTLGNKVVRDGHGAAACLRLNYGWGGRAYVAGIDPDKARERYNYYTRQLEGIASGKQTMAGAVLLTADELATELIFRDGRALTPTELGVFLSSDADADVNKRGYDYLCGWVAQNAAAFGESSRGEQYGVLESSLGNEEIDTAYVIKTVMRDVLQRAGYSYKSLQAWLVQRGLLKMRGRNYTVTKRINGILTECYKITLLEDLPDGWRS